MVIGDTQPCGSPLFHTQTRHASQRCAPRRVINKWPPPLHCFNARGGFLISGARSINFTEIVLVSRVLYP